MKQARPAGVDGRGCDSWTSTEGGEHEREHEHEHELEMWSASPCSERLASLADEIGTRRCTRWSDAALPSGT